MEDDVWGLRADPDIAVVAAKRNAPVILMHNRSNPASVEVKERLGNAYTGAQYENLIEDVKRELMDSVAIARRAGLLLRMGQFTPDRHAGDRQVATEIALHQHADGVAARSGGQLA